MLPRTGAKCARKRGALICSKWWAPKFVSCFNPLLGCIANHSTVVSLSPLTAKQHFSISALPVAVAALVSFPFLPSSSASSYQLAVASCQLPFASSSPTYLSPNCSTASQRRKCLLFTLIFVQICILIYCRHHDTLSYGGIASCLALVCYVELHIWAV